MNEVDLMPCPFCGGKAHKRIAFPIDADGMEVNMYIVGCEACDIEFYGPWDEEAVIEQWNTRKPMDEGIEKLKEEMVFYEQIKKETEEKDYRYLYHKIAEAYGKAVVIMHKSKWQERGADDELHN